MIHFIASAGTRLEWGVIREERHAGCDDNKCRLS